MPRPVGGRGPAANLPQSGPAPAQMVPASVIQAVHDDMVNNPQNWQDAFAAVSDYEPDSTGGGGNGGDAGGDTGEPAPADASPGKYAVPPPGERK